jgi:hypothetical protein
VWSVVVVGGLLLDLRRQPVEGSYFFNDGKKKKSLDLINLLIGLYIVAQKWRAAKEQ